MIKAEILKHIVNCHNCLVGIMVSGDSAIMMGETLKELRFLASEVQKDVEAEEIEETQREQKE